MIKTSKTLTILMVVTFILIAIVSVALGLTLYENINVEMGSATGGMYLTTNIANAATTGSYPAVIVNATITNSLNNSVNWSLAWEDASNSANVSDYVTLTTSGLKATLLCKQKFANRMVLTCSATGDNASATCLVRYAGVPTSVELDANSYNSDAYPTYAEIFSNGELTRCEYQEGTDPSINSGYLGRWINIPYISTPEDYQWDFELKYSNAFGEITDAEYINKNVRVDITPVGKIYVLPSDGDGTYDTSEGLIEMSFSEFYVEAQDTIRAYINSDGDFVLEMPPAKDLCALIDNEFLYYVDGDDFGFSITISADGIDGTRISDTIFVRPELPSSSLLTANVALDQTEVVL